MKLKLFSCVLKVNTVLWEKYFIKDSKIAEIWLKLFKWWQTKKKKQKLKINRQILQQVKNYKYLETIIDYSAKVDQDVTETTGTAARLFYTL